MEHNEIWDAIGELWGAVAHATRRRLAIQEEIDGMRHEIDDLTAALKTAGIHIGRTDLQEAIRDDAESSGVFT